MPNFNFFLQKVLRSRILVVICELKVNKRRLSYYFPRQADNDITLRLQDLQKQQIDEQERVLKQMENRSRMKMEDETVR